MNREQLEEIRDLHKGWRSSATVCPRQGESCTQCAKRAAATAERVPALLDEIDRLNIALGACQTALNHHLEARTEATAHLRYLVCGCGIAPDAVPGATGCSPSCMAPEPPNDALAQASVTHVWDEARQDWIHVSQWRRETAAATAEGSAEGGTSKGSSDVPTEGGAHP